MSGENKMAEIKIKYQKSDDYKIHPITGAFGSLNPQGLVICDFYLEKISNPDETVLSFDETTGNLISEKKDEEKKSIIREFLVGIALQPEISRTIGEWLIQRADEYKKLSEKKT